MARRNQRATGIPPVIPPGGAYIFSEQPAEIIRVDSVITDGSYTSTGGQNDRIKIPFSSVRFGPATIDSNQNLQFADLVVDDAPLLTITLQTNTVPANNFIWGQWDNGTIFLITQTHIPTTSPVTISNIQIFPPNYGKFPDQYGQAQTLTLYTSSDNNAVFSWSNGHVFGVDEVLVWPPVEYAPIPPSIIGTAPPPSTYGKALLTATIADGNTGGPTSGWYHFRFASVTPPGIATINTNGDLVFATTPTQAIYFALNFTMGAADVMQAAVAWDAGTINAIASGPSPYSVAVTSILPPNGHTLALYVGFNLSATMTWTGVKVFIPSPDLVANITDFSTTTNPYQTTFSGVSVGQKATIATDGSLYFGENNSGPSNLLLDVTMTHTTATNLTISYQWGGETLQTASVVPLVANVANTVTNVAIAGPTVGTHNQLYITFGFANAGTATWSGGKVHTPITSSLLDIDVSAASVFPGFTPIIPPPLIGQGGGAAPAFPPPTPPPIGHIPAGVLVGPAIAAAAVPPSTPGFIQPRYGSGSATVPHTLFPYSTTTYPSPPIVFSNIFTGGTSPTTPPHTTTTQNVPVGGWGPPVGPAFPPPSFTLPTLAADE
jgi:hypothetical protein